jgi:hypothetical protein
MRETNSKKKLAGINKTLRKRFLDEKGCKVNSAVKWV